MVENLQSINILFKGHSELGMGSKQRSAHSSFSDVGAIEGLDGVFICETCGSPELSSAIGASVTSECELQSTRL
jgi:hypothetical protein